MKHLFLLAVAVASIAACDHDDHMAPVNPLVGTYALQTVNAQKLPMVLRSDTLGDTLSALSGRVVLRADSSFSEIVTFSIAQMGFPGYVAADTLLGYYTQSGNALTMNSQYGQYVIVAQGKVLTEVDGSYVLEYKKQ